MTYLKVTLCAAAACLSGLSAASGQQLNPQQIQMIKDVAVSICNTIKEAKGQKSDVQLQGDVTAQLGGLAGKIGDAGVSGRGSLTHEDYEGISREATAAALEGDRACRERIFETMYGWPSRQSPPVLQPANRDSGQPRENPSGRTKPSQRNAVASCRNPPAHYWCDSSGCLHRTFNAALMNLPQVRQCPSWR